MKIKLTNQIEVLTTPGIEQQIIKSFTFANPKYNDALIFGRSTRGLDRKIELVERSSNGLIAPMGTLDYLLQTFSPEVQDQRTIKQVIIPFNGMLRPYQETFIAEAFNHTVGMLVAATGAGKTVCGIALASALKQRTLILVKSKDLAEQWKEAINQFTGLNAGLIGGGKCKEGDQFTIGLVQTLVKKDLSLLEYGLVIADECHNLPSNQAYTVMNGLNSKYKYGLSATPQRRDNMEFMMHGAVGQAISQIKPDELDGKVLPVYVSTIEIPFNTEVESWSEFLNVLVDDEQRNQVIVERAVKASQVMGTIILCSQIRHCELLGDMCNELGVYPLVLHGQLPTKTRAERRAKASKVPLIIGTLSLLSEGTDLPHLSALIFASPVSASIDRNNPAATRLIQSVGRCRRPYINKTKAYVLDIVDRCGFGVSAFNKRAVIYKQQGFKITKV